jgi:predicted DNA-binding protein YlxM (UPF0122 family)
MTNDPNAITGDPNTTRELLSRQLADTIDSDPLAALPTIVAVQRDTDQLLREAVKRAAVTSSWREIATELGVSKQAAHQRFKTYAKDVTEEMKAQHKELKRARRRNDADGAAQARARRDELAMQLRVAAESLKDRS